MHLVGLYTYTFNIFSTLWFSYKHTHQHYSTASFGFNSVEKCRSIFEPSIYFYLRYTVKFKPTFTQEITRFYYPSYFSTMHSPEAERHFLPSLSILAVSTFYLVYHHHFQAIPAFQTYQNLWAANSAPSFVITPKRLSSAPVGLSSTHTPLSFRHHNATYSFLYHFHRDFYNERSKRSDSANHTFWWG